MLSTIRSLTLTALLAVSLSACGSDDDPAPTQNNGGNKTVTMGAASFSPTTLTVPRNSVVTWSNTSGVLHNVTFSTAGSPPNIGDHTSGSTTRTFSDAGTFNYMCTNHEGMTGSIVVQ